MFALIVLLLSVFCVCFNCALAVGVLCLLLTVLLLSMFCFRFYCALAIGVLCLL